MSTQAFSTAGTVISISAGVPATQDAAGFAALTYTKIGDTTDIGSIGPKVAIVTHVPVDQSVTFKVKTITDNGNLQLKGARVTTDPGQMLLLAGVASFNPYAVKIAIKNGSVMYCQVLVSSYNTTLGTAGVITTFDSDLAITGDIVTVG